MSSTSENMTSAIRTLARLAEVVPDVEDQIGLSCSSAYSSPDGLWQRQKQRRASILCQTRTLIGREGYPNFNIRRLADHCSLSSQTIYNLVGDRDEVISAATCQHLDALLKSAARLEDYPCFIAALADASWYHAIRNPGYAKTVIHTHIRSRSQAADKMQTVMRTALRQVLEDMTRQSRLRQGTNIELLAERIHSLIVFTGFSWAEGGCDDAGLRQQLGTGTGLLLLGAMTKLGRESVERWVDDIQQPS